MQRPAEGSESACRGCGRPLDECSAHVHHSTSAVYVYHRCSCGVEWTEMRPSVDRSQPVSGDEVIEVHKLLGSFEGPLPTLIESEQNS